MPSLQDVADQINAKLDQITTNTAATATGIVAVDGTLQAGFADLQNRLNAVDATLQSGFVNLGAGLFAILEVQRSALAELVHHSAQNSTIICLLENTTELLCGITRKMTRHIAIADQTLTSVERIEGITERVQPGPAADFDRHLELAESMEKCCPPDETPPEPCPEPCPVPRHDPRPPEGQDWTPLKPRRSRG